MKAEEVFESMATKGELDSFVTRISNLLKEFKEKRKQLLDVQDRISEAVASYKKARFSLLLKLWQEKEKGWCTRCEKVVPLKELKLLFIEGSSWHGGGFEDFKELHTACNLCFLRAFSRTGHESGGNKFWAFEAKKENENVQIFRFGKWESLPQDTEIKRKSDYISLGLAREWGLPPEISFYPFPAPRLTIDYKEVEV